MTFWSHVYETAMAPSLAISALQETLFIKKLGFRVTNKGITNRNIQIVWSSLLPYVILLIGTIFGFLRQSSWIFNGYLVPTFYWINDFWAFNNLVGIIMSVYVSIELPRPRKSERLVIQVHVKLHTSGFTYKGFSIDLSETGVRIQLFESVIGTTTRLDLSIKGIKGHVKQTQTLISDKFEMRLVWGELPLSQYKQLDKLLY